MTGRSCLAIDSPAAAELYNYFRDYDPSIGRYVESDPLGIVPALNTFAYASLSPLVLYDPDGLWAWGDPVPQGVMDAFVGFGDSVSLGLTGVLRDALDVDGGVNECSTAYKTGAWAGIFYSGWRLAYAGAAKAGAAMASSGAEASAFRSGLRRAFGNPDKIRKPNLGKYHTEGEIRDAAGRTNPAVNAWAAGAGLVGADELNKCGCKR